MEYWNIGITRKAARRSALPELRIASLEATDQKRKMVRAKRPTLEQDNETLGSNPSSDRYIAIG